MFRICWTLKPIHKTNNIFMLAYLLRLDGLGRSWQDVRRELIKPRNQTICFANLLDLPP